MSRESWISEEVETFIAKQATKYRHRNRATLAREIRIALKKKGMRVPAQSTVEKKITEYVHELGTQDDPWNLESMDLPPEALPSILRVWVYAREYVYHALTNRDAKWVARLYMVISDLVELTVRSLEYSSLEMTSDVIKQDFHVLPQAPLDLYELMTGEKIEGERRRHILEDSKEYDWASRAEIAPLMKAQMKKGVTDEGSHNQEVQE